MWLLGPDAHQALVPEQVEELGTAPPCTRPGSAPAGPWGDPREACTEVRAGKWPLKPASWRPQMWWARARVDQPAETTTATVSSFGDLPNEGGRWPRPPGPPAPGPEDLGAHPDRLRGLLQGMVGMLTEAEVSAFGRASDGERSPKHGERSRRRLAPRAGPPGGWGWPSRLWARARTFQAPGAPSASR